MSDLFSLSAAGLAFLFLAFLESLSVPSAPALLPLPLLSRLRFLTTFFFSSIAVFSSLVSAFFSTADPLGAYLSLSSLAVAALFLVYALAGLLSSSSSIILFGLFPPELLDLLLLFSFGQEFLLFYLRHKDLVGVENRYFDLLLVPILVCAVSTLLAIAQPRSPAPRLARAAGLALHGTWFIQMGFSFFTNLIVDGCSLRLRSRANYTITCKTHEDYHRGRAIASLQFNCHLAFLVLVGSVVYSAVAGRANDAPGYRPLSKELEMADASPSNFTLDSDDEEEIVVADTTGTKQQTDLALPVVVRVDNSNGSH